MMLSDVAALIVAHPSVDSNAAVLMMLAGVLLVYAEFNMPGKVIPGCLGTLLFLGGIFRISQMPLRPFGVLLAGAGFLALLLALRFPFRGLLAAAGVGLLLAGLPLLIARPAAVVSWWAACSAAGILGTTTVVLGRVTAIARRNKFGPAQVRPTLIRLNPPKLTATE
jgi:membrane-bound serine protease (ClpP class)